MVVSQFRLRSVVAVLFLSFFLLLPSISVGIRHMPITKMPTRIENLFRFSEAPEYRNGVECPSTAVLNGGEKVSLCEESFVHVAMTLDTEYLRGSMAAVHSILRHASCPENVFFHFIASEFDEASPKLLSKLVESVFPSLNFRVYIFREDTVVHLISSSIRQALENPLNYARNYLGDILNPCIKRVIYLDSDVVVVDDIRHLWNTKLADSHVIAAPEYCHANFTKYFTDTFWSDPILPRVFGSRNPCYFNTGVMVMDLTKWREQNCRGKLEHWMELQRKRRIYELGSLPPFLLVFGGLLKPVNHRWNQHGLGGDNVKGSCRALHPGPISLLHWSGKGKPWARLDEKSPCPVDYLWEPYDLYKPKPKPNQQALLSSSGGSNLLGFS